MTRINRSKTKRIKQNITQQAQAIPVDAAAHNATAITDGVVATEAAAKATTGVEQPTQQADAPQEAKQSDEQQANTEAAINAPKAIRAKKSSRCWFSRLLHWLLTPIRWLGKSLGL